MKTYIVIVLAFLNSYIAVGQTNQNNLRDLLMTYEKYKLGVISRSTDGIMAVVYCPAPEGSRVAKVEGFDSSKPIYYRFITCTNKATLLYLLRPEYAFRISAVSESGRAVGLTRKGSDFGKKFDDVKELNREANSAITAKAFAASNEGEFVNGIQWAVPDELFTFDKPGKYTLTIEAACFADESYLLSHDSSPTKFHYLRFPPVKLQIVKINDEK